MMLRANLVQAVFIGSLLLTPVLVGHVSDAVVLLWVYLAVFVTNAAGQYFNQGRLAWVAVSVPAEARTAAFGMQGVAVNLLSIVGPPLAAPLLFSVGVDPGLALNAVSFLLSSAVAVLAAYGLANTAAANLPLTGVLGPVADPAATRGHAWLWDPLFLAWGLGLGVGLWRTRPGLAPKERPRPSLSACDASTTRT